MDKRGVLEFLKKNKFCVIATSNKEGKPEAAVMAFVVKDDFSILMSTESTTRKFGNLTVNNQATVVVGGLNNDPTVQIDGVSQIFDGEAAEDAKKEMLAAQPELAAYFDSPGIRFFSVKPTWLRYSSFADSPRVIVEFTDF